MITLAGISVSKNMHLLGVTQANQVAYQHTRTVEGVSKLLVKPTPGGRVMSISSSQIGNAVQGIWCQSVIDEIKAVEKLASPVLLDYYGDLYTVYIVDTTDFTQMFQFEPISPTKSYTGKVTIIEV